MAEAPRPTPATTPTSAGAAVAPQAQRFTWRDLLTTWAFLVPNLVGVVTFVLFPVVASLALGFVAWRGDRLEIDAIEWVGLGNFSELMQDGLFWQAVWNTLVLMLGVPLRLFGCLAMAMLLNQRIREVVVFRTLYFLPTVCSSIALFILWQGLYNPDVGVINHLLSYLLIDGPNWLGDPYWAKPAFIITGFWQNLGGLTMLLYLAALQGVPEQLYEASEIDGASAWQRFWRITWPMVSPTTFFVLTMGIIRGFQGGFQQAYIMTRGGPAGATTTIDYFIYNQAFFLEQRMGYASAAAWTLFVIILIVTLVQWRVAQRRVHY